MKQFITIFMLMALGLVCSCGDKPTSKGRTYSFELLPGSKDTINVIDTAGKKQGKWLFRKYIVFNRHSGAQPVWWQSGHYVDGKREGYWKVYEESGRIKDSLLFRDDVVVN